jgi:hypothetical protein
MMVNAFQKGQLIEMVRKRVGRPPIIFTFLSRPTKFHFMLIDWHRQVHTKKTAGLSLDCCSKIS